MRRSADVAVDRLVGRVIERVEIVPLESIMPCSSNLRKNEVFVGGAASAHTQAAALLRRCGQGGAAANGAEL